MMKRIYLVLCTLLAMAGGMPLKAQPKPVMTNLVFINNDGDVINKTGLGRVVVEITFSEDMDQTVEPTIEFSLDRNFNQSVLSFPATGGWALQGNNAARVWQGDLNITTNLPSTGDGVYYFRVSGAKSYDGAVMDTTVASATLEICRAAIVIANKTLDFGAVGPGETKVLSLTIRNPGCEPLQINNVRVPEPFALINTLRSFTIQPGASVALPIRLYSTTRRVLQDSLIIVANKLRPREYVVYLRGVVRGPQIGVIPPVLEFGRVSIDSSVTRTVWVFNIPGKPDSLNEVLRVSNITTNASAGAFTFQPSRFDVAPGDTQRVQVTFRPDASQNYSGRIYFHNNDIVRRQISIVLRATAEDNSPPPPVTGLNVSWGSRYSGYTNRDSLYICWSRVNDPSGISQIRWKFTRSPVPPTSNDDLGSGGWVSLDSSATCVWLPLRGRLSTGFWYFYIWFVDGRGNSGYANAVRTVLRYDNTPPGRAVIARASYPYGWWFNEYRRYTVRLRLPVDQAKGYVDAAEVRWAFNKRPASGDAYAGRYVIPGNAGSTVDVPIPLTQQQCGENEIYFWLADSAGNVGEVASASSTKFTYDACAPVITRVTGSRNSIAEVGQAFRDTVKVTDDSGVDTVWVEYRFGGATATEPPHPLTLIPGTKDSFEVYIPAGAITRRGLEYRIIARDSLNHQAVGPTSGSACSGSDKWISLSTKLPSQGITRVDSDGKPVPLNAGETELSYQLFSVPVQLEFPTIDSVLVDDLGPYDDKQWRIFDYLPQNSANNRWVEGAGIRDFKPGRAFFLITRKEDIIIDSGPGSTRRTVCPDTLTLYEGWNLIATPFNFPVHKDALSLINSNSPITLRSFEAGWNITDVMMPWRGYALYVTRAENAGALSPIQLVIQPRATTSRAYKMTGSQEVLSPGEWHIRIAARAGNLHDLDNFAGVRSGARDGFDPFEMAEPPVIGEYLQVAFPKPEWQQPAALFSTDFRGENASDLSWEFSLRSSQPGKPVQLTFDLEGDLPPQATVWLVDEVAGMAQNLRENHVYTLLAGDEGVDRRLKLVVGSRDFAETQAGEIDLVPTEFSLSQNYPNPFNPQTTIRFSLPHSAEVRVVVYDQLGRLVRTLVQGSRPAGTHTVIWDGRNDEGRQVASGVYVYKIISGTRSISRKMLLLQ